MHTDQVMSTACQNTHCKSKLFSSLLYGRTGTNRGKAQSQFWHFGTVMICNCQELRQARWRGACRGILLPNSSQARTFLPQVLLSWRKHDLPSHTPRLPGTAPPQVVGRASWAPPTGDIYPPSPPLPPPHLPSLAIHLQTDICNNLQPQPRKRSTARSQLNALHTRIRRSKETDCDYW